MKGGPPPPSTPPPPDAYNFLQLDGNLSVDSTLIENESEYIPVHIGYRPEKLMGNRPPPQGKPSEETIKPFKLLLYPPYQTTTCARFLGKF